MWWVYRPRVSPAGATSALSRPGAAAQPVAAQQNAGLGLGLWLRDLLISAGGQPVTRSQDLQKLMFSEAIGRPLAITVMRNGALVDVIAQPSELVAA